MTDEQATAAEVEEETTQEEQQPEEQHEETSDENQEVGRVVQAVRQDYQSKLDEERRARQQAEAELQQYRQRQQPVDGNDDDEEIITKAELKKALSVNAYTWQRQTLEQAWVASNKDRVQEIEAYLPEVLKQKPWLADAIEKAPNRYEAAADIIGAYKPKEKSSAKRIVENASKPGNPSAMGKTAQLSNVEKLKAMSPKEFREYRKQLLNRR
jgi:hypothetical protein